MFKGADHHRSPSRDRERATKGGSLGLRLGLIGDNISQSKAPLLHSLGGKLAGRSVSYDRLVPRELGIGFDEIFEACAARGYRGVNITYPYKERAARRVQVEDPLVRAMGSVNTVLFEPTGPWGYNTDYSGFIAAYRQARGEAPAGRVCLIGAGGVGKAVAFGLLMLGLEGIWIIDLDAAKAEDLAVRLGAAAPSLSVTLAEGSESLPVGLDGLINCTQVGMVGYEGSPLPKDRMQGAGWAFDAVYTPPETQFLRDAKVAGRTVITGYELFFHQGVDAWQLFAGRPIDAAQLRRRLREASAGPEG